ncbi:DNA polymerase-3 subunit delta' [Marinilabilia salmonicolor]|jgi:DNA polymerase-3 subunit delta'|uniref:DNA polymerase III subunit n=1 Tax=Marinilabilia salmonicolor TaxID=989 RepID=UPI000D05911B|nr:DNA polymerase III subunit [Marinilabilia salmonicolor]PRY99777.1 DNA polymerase-3 subunit delta' [Marinilabilia salmonicolor]
MLFKDVVGQKAVKDHLISMVREDRISHAQLFTGPAGAGLMPLALAFAQYVNCHNPGPEDSCGVCPSCKKMAKLIHPDFHFVFPIVKRGSEKNPVCADYLTEWREFVLKSPYFTIHEWFSFLNAEKSQGMIYTQEGNEIIKRLSLKNFEGKYKIMVVWQPEKMHNSAANRLLKILEEPPARTLFILVSDYPAGILPTILSRTQQLKIPRIDDAALTQGLMGTFGVEEAEAKTVARISGGDFVKARDIVGNSEEKQYFNQMFVNFMRFSYKGQLGEIAKWVDELSGLPKERLKNLLLYCIAILRESYIANYDIADLVYATPAENNFIDKFKPFVNDRNVESMVEEFSLALAHIEQNGNIRLVLFDMAIKISSWFRISNKLV